MIRHSKCCGTTNRETVSASATSIGSSARPASAVAKLLPPLGQPLAAIVERFGAVGNVVAAAGEGVQRLHSPPLIERQQPIDAGKVRRRPPRNAAAGTKAGFELGRHPRHQTSHRRRHADDASKRSFVSRPTVRAARPDIVTASPDRGEDGLAAADEQPHWQAQVASARCSRSGCPACSRWLASSTSNAKQLAGRRHRTSRRRNG